MEGGEAESARRERVKELEAMVVQLAKENQKLLGQVTDSEGQYREEASAARERGRLADATSTEDLISLDGDLCEAKEDSWLFVSPAKPPTPSQKRVTPSQWLEEGGVAIADDPVFSLDEVRKDLSFQISNAEGLSPSNARRTPRGGVVSPLAARRKLANPTAQRYLDQVRERRNSPPVEMEVATPPRGSGEVSPEGERVPVMKWRKSVLPEPPSEPETVPVVRWKKPVIPDQPQDEDVPVVRWKKPVIPDQPQDEDVPVVRWKKPVIPDQPQDEDVPVVRWKKPVIPQTDPPSPASTETIPVVKWKRPVIPQEDPPEEMTVPTVRWKRPVIPQEMISDEASTGALKPRQQRNVPAKAITTTVRSPPEGEEEEETEFRGHQSHTLPRASGRRSLGGGLRPPGGERGGVSPPHYRQRNASAERASQREAAALRSRSPSPGLRRHVQLGSSSPSPTFDHTPNSTPRTVGRSARPRPSLSPPRFSLQPPGKQSLVKSPSAPGPRKQITPPSSGSRGRGMPHSGSAPSGQRFPGASQPGLSPPSRRKQVGVVTTPPRVPRPRTQQSPQRGGGVVQPSPPRAGPGPQIRPARHTAAPPTSRHRKTQSNPAATADDDWLEGCY